MKIDKKWERNYIAFPRLLCTVVACPFPIVDSSSLDHNFPILSAAASIAIHIDIHQYVLPRTYHIQYYSQSL